MDDLVAADLTASDWDDFDELLDAALELKLRGKKWRFVADMKEKFDEYGDETYVSRAQYDWLKSIVDKGR